MTSGGVEVKGGRWFELGYFRYETIHKKWQYYLFRMVKAYFGYEAINRLLNELWKKYPKGLDNMKRVDLRCSYRLRYDMNIKRNQNKRLKRRPTHEKNSIHWN